MGRRLGKGGEAVDGEVGEVDGMETTLTAERFVGNAIEGAVVDVDVVHSIGFVYAVDLDAVTGLLASDVLHPDVVDVRNMSTLGFLARFVIDIDTQDALATLAYTDVTHEDILGFATTTGVGLETEHTVEVGGIHVTIFGKDVLDTCGDLATDDNSAMSVLHGTTTNDNITSRTCVTTTIGISTALDGNTIVSGMEDAILDKDVFATLGITTIAVGTFINYRNITHCYVTAKEGMDDPEGRIRESDALDEDVLRINEIDELRT